LVGWVGSRSMKWTHGQLWFTQVLSTSYLQARLVIW